MEKCRDMGDVQEVKRRVVVGGARPWQSWQSINIGNQIDIIVSAVVVVRWGGRRPSQDVGLGLGEGGRWKGAMEGRATVGRTYM